MTHHAFVLFSARIFSHHELLVAGQKALRWIASLSTKRWVKVSTQSSCHHLIARVVIVCVLQRAETVIERVLCRVKAGVVTSSFNKIAHLTSTFWEMCLNLALLYNLPRYLLSKLCHVNLIMLSRMLFYKVIFSSQCLSICAKMLICSDFEAFLIMNLCSLKLFLDFTIKRHHKSLIVIVLCAIKSFWAICSGWIAFWCALKYHIIAICYFTMDLIKLSHLKYVFLWAMNSNLADKSTVWIFTRYLFRFFNFVVNRWINHLHLE